jgi:hypothetical protein
MRRKRITTEVFKDRKFQENNLVQIREAIRDVCKSYGIAAALTFLESSHFLPKVDLQGRDDQGLLILDKFKEWLKISSTSDIAFKHRSSAFTVYGPLLRLYDAATAFGDGYARELVYQAQVPIYAQLGFRNYFTEVFRHVVNFLVKWPTATRRYYSKTVL